MVLHLDPPTVLEISDRRAGLSGWLAVDSVIDRHFCGGLRMLPDVTAPELTELARAMTLKHAFLGIPHGGAKSGIVCEEGASREKRRGLLAAFGREIKALLSDRVYLPGSDMGTTDQDIRDMLAGLGIRVPKRALRGENSGWYTSRTVLAAARAGCAAQGFDLVNATCAIEGFGAVGGAVAEGLARLGSRVLAISTSRGALYAPEGLDVADLLRSARRHGTDVVDSYDGAERLPRESLLELDVDVLLPCARHHSIHGNNVSKIRARLVSSGANAPVTEEAERLLPERGILCIPDFVSNAGGVLGGTMEFAGLRRAAIVAFIERDFVRQVTALIEGARTGCVRIRELAESVARERFERMKRAGEKRSLSRRAFSLGLGLYRNGLIPEFCAGALAGRYFQRRIEGRF